MDRNGGARGPRVVISAPLFNKAEYLPEAVESILAQTYRDFALILIDDRSTDETQEVAERFAAQDERVTYVRNEQRLGMLDNTRRSYELARSLYPNADYYALGSDHDLWHPEWLEALVKALDDDPSVVLAYSRTQRISESGEIDRGPWSFDTYGIADPRKRFRAAFHGMTAGDMIYGLFRVEVLDEVGSYRSVLVPDRLLLSELAWRGPFKQVDGVLWSRRFRGLASLERQRKAFFLDAAPRYTELPWWLTHTAVVFQSYVLQGNGGGGLSRSQGLIFTLDYLGASVRHRAHRRYGKLALGFRRFRRRFKRDFTSELKRAEKRWDIGLRSLVVAAAVAARVSLKRELGPARQKAMGYRKVEQGATLARRVDRRTRLSKRATRQLRRTAKLPRRIERRARLSKRATKLARRVERRTRLSKRATKLARRVERRTRLSKRTARLRHRLRMSKPQRRRLRHVRSTPRRMVRRLIKRLRPSLGRGTRRVLANPSARRVIVESVVPGLRSTAAAMRNGRGDLGERHATPSQGVSERAPVQEKNFNP